MGEGSHFLHVMQMGLAGTAGQEDGSFWDHVWMQYEDDGTC